MGIIPVNPSLATSASPSALDRVERLAFEIARDHPEILLPAPFRGLEVEQFPPGCTIHLDDLSAIALREPTSDLYLQERARLRAGHGDLVVAATPQVPGFEPYARHQLGLGEAEWFHVACDSPLRAVQLARTCREDRTARHRLTSLVRQSELTYLHPHMGTPSVWALASVLRRAAHRDVRVVAPPPGLCQWVNDKLAFAETVGRLFGRRWRPTTNAAANFATLAGQVATLARETRTLVIKRPVSAGGEGNLVLEAAPFRRLSLRAVRRELVRKLAWLNWSDREPLLIGTWETDVLSSPSVQTWIPPADAGPPVVEGIFDQILSGQEGVFLGCTQAELSPPLMRTAAQRGWLLALLFQKLGYVGRCSFDLLVLGTRMANARLEFIECNGRWGGTSGPMTLLTRLFGHWASRPFAAFECPVPPQSTGWCFDALTQQLGAELYDARSGRGNLILFNPGRLRARSELQFIALGETWSEAVRRARETVPDLLHGILGEPPADSEAARELGTAG
ncbi:MAG: hypothetical protein U0794_11515 [Isosphaeraceae bacterium]